MLNKTTQQQLIGQFRDCFLQLSYLENTILELKKIPCASPPGDCEDKTEISTELAKKIHWLETFTSDIRKNLERRLSLLAMFEKQPELEDLKHNHIVAIPNFNPLFVKTTPAESDFIYLTQRAKEATKRLSADFRSLADFYNEVMLEATKPYAAVSKTY